MRLNEKKINIWIRQKTNVKCVVANHVSRLNCSFAGHNARQREEIQNTVIQQCRPYLGNRTCGRPQMKLGNDLKKTADFDWNETSQKRKRQNKLEEAYIHGWTMKD